MLYNLHSLSCVFAVRVQAQAGARRFAEAFSSSLGAAVGFTLVWDLGFRV